MGLKDYLWNTVRQRIIIANTKTDNKHYIKLLSLRILFENSYLVFIYHKKFFNL